MSSNCPWRQVTRPILTQAALEKQVCIQQVHLSKCSLRISLISRCLKQWFLSSRRIRCSNRTSKSNWPHNPQIHKSHSSAGIQREACTQHTTHFCHPKSSLSQGVSQEMEVIKRKYQRGMAALNEEHKRNKEMISAMAAYNKICSDRIIADAAQLKRSWHMLAWCDMPASSKKGKLRLKK